MTCDNLRRSLGFCVMLCVQLSSALRSAQDFQNKVSLLLRDEPDNPKCFTEGRKDFTCFWEDREPGGHVGQYAFTYAYQHENRSHCPLTTHHAADGRRLFVCHLNSTQMFVQMDITVQHQGVLIHNRSLLIELVFLLDPPGNLSVSQTEQPGQLRVSWIPPAVKYLDDSMLYEVHYGPAQGAGSVLVEEVRARSEVMLRGLSPGTLYTVRARVKLDGISYNGYWSAWADPVSMETPPAGVDLLIISLVAVISVIVSLLSVILILSHRRFIKTKIWPAIPNPESKFQGLFTVYGGDFREWLGHTNGSLWLRPAFFSSEERPSPLEILSELSLGPLLPSPPLPLKASRAGPVRSREEEVREEKPSRKEEGSGGVWRETPHDHWLMEQLRALHRLPAPCSQSSLLEAQDAYVTLDAQQQAGTELEEHLDDIMEESSPLEVLFASSHSDLGSMRPSSGSGRLSSGSSLEYPNHTWPPKGHGYTYMAVADSGVSMDYSPMSSSRIHDVGKTTLHNEYKNHILVQQRPALTRQPQVHPGW